MAVVDAQAVLGSPLVQLACVDCGVVLGNAVPSLAGSVGLVLAELHTCATRLQVAVA